MSCVNINSHPQTLKLLIIDEVHLLNEERGAVIETIVARTLRQARSFFKWLIILPEIIFRSSLVNL